MRSVRGKFFLFFPAKNKDGIFQMGVATSDSPTGPFNAEPEPIKGSFSIDPAVFKDDDGAYYMYFGGIWGGQLQRWATGSYVAEDKYPASNEPAYSPKIARMSDDLLQFAEAPKDVQILDGGGVPLLGTDTNRRFFEAAWVHKFNGKYYFSYSTGDTHLLCYAVADTPYGPFTYQGPIMSPVIGWTTHHSICQFQGRWYLFYHDSMLSGGSAGCRDGRAAVAWRGEGRAAVMAFHVRHQRFVAVGLFLPIGLALLLVAHLLRPASPVAGCAGLPWASCRAGPR